MFDYPKGKPEPVSIIVPCYNASRTIGRTVGSLLDLDYPRGMIEIIVVDDKSEDDTVEIVNNYVKKYKNVRLIVNRVNSGGAAEPTNLGILAAKYRYIAVTDDDSSPQPDALKKMIGFLQQDEKIGAVTCCVLAKKPKRFMQRLQAIEYVVIAFGRKILDFIGAVYVTPGPFALYKRDVLIEVGLFDKQNLTQDIEIVWRLIANGYSVRMCLAAKVYSETPDKFRKWWRQRVRWNIGGTQSILKHRRYVFRKGMLGAFIIPYFSASLFLGLFGLGMFIYLFARRLLYYYLSTKYSVYAQVALFTLDDFSFAPSILNFLGGALFILGAGFTFLMISVMKEKEVRVGKILNIAFYQIVYLTIYPFIMVRSMYKLMTGKYSW